MLCALWNRLKAACFRSVTMAWGYALGAVGGLMQRIDDLASLVGDASFTQQVQSVLGTDPKVLGRYLSVAALITIVSRARGLFAGKKPS